MTFAVLRLPLLLALLALSLTEAGLTLAVIVIPALPAGTTFDTNRHTPTTKPATAAGVLVLGGLLSVAWCLCAVLGRGQRLALLQTRWEMFWLFVLWVWHVGAAGLLSAHHPITSQSPNTTSTELRRAQPLSDLQQSPLLPTLLSSLSLISWATFGALSIVAGVTAALFIRRWAAYEDGVSTLPAERLWEEGWWGGVGIAKPVRKSRGQGVGRCGGDDGARSEGASAGDVELVPTVVVSFADDKHDEYASAVKSAE